MKAGDLIIETRASHPGLVRILTSATISGDDSVLTSDTRPVIRYMARFDDLDTARLHAFSALRRHMLDVDAALFHVPVEEAIAVVESIGLPHRRIYLDPELPAHSVATIEARTRVLRNRRKRREAVWQWIGWLALGWLTLWFVLSF